MMINDPRQPNLNYVRIQVDFQQNLASFERVLPGSCRNG